MGPKNLFQFTQAVVTPAWALRCEFFGTLCQSIVFRHSRRSDHGERRLLPQRRGALSKEQALVIGPSREQVPLQDIGDKAERFSRLCQKT